jgi:hypothetical protein
MNIPDDPPAAIAVRRLKLTAHDYVARSESRIGRAILPVSTTAVAARHE